MQTESYEAFCKLNPRYNSLLVKNHFLSSCIHFGRGTEPIGLNRESFAGLGIRHFQYWELLGSIYRLASIVFHC
jgi:hypothetical protein